MVLSRVIDVVAIREGYKFLRDPFAFEQQGGRGPELLSFSLYQVLVNRDPSASTASSSLVKPRIMRHKSSTSRE